MQAVFSEGEKNVALCFLLQFFKIHIWPASTLLRGHLALATLSLLETDPQILERWGFADEVHLGNSFREFHTLDWFLHVFALSKN